MYSMRHTPSSETIRIVASDTGESWGTGLRLAHRQGTRRSAWWSNLGGECSYRRAYFHFVCNVLQKLVTLSLLRFVGYSGSPSITK